MAGKSALPLIAAAGLAAVVLTKKKKKKGANGGGGGGGEDNGGDGETKFPQWVEKLKGGGIGDLEISPDGQAKMIFDESCQAFADKLNADAHNTYITGSFHTLVKSGVNSADEIVAAMLRDQAPQCPWEEPASYTDLMRGVYDQLIAAVRGYGEQVGVELS